MRQGKKQLKTKNKVDNQAAYFVLLSSIFKTVQEGKQIPFQK